MVPGFLLLAASGLSILLKGAFAKAANWAIFLTGSYVFYKELDIPPSEFPKYPGPVGTGGVLGITGYDWKGLQQFHDIPQSQVLNDPLILDLNRDGQLNLSNATFFDFNANGFHELASWIDETDAFLVLDKNFKGIVSITLPPPGSTGGGGNTLPSNWASFTLEEQTQNFTDQARFPMYSIPHEYLEVPDDIAALPGLMGFGNMHDLHQALVRCADGIFSHMTIELCKLGAQHVSYLRAS